MPFTFVHAGKYVTEDESKTRHITKTKHNPEKANNTKYRRTEQNSSLFVAETKLRGASWDTLSLVHL